MLPEGFKKPRFVEKRDEVSFVGIMAFLVVLGEKIVVEVRFRGWTKVSWKREV